MKWSDDPFQLPARVAIGRMIEQYLNEAEHAYQRLMADAERPSDSEALHDFRVALRRLRSTLRTYRPELKGWMRKRREKQLRKAMGTTGQARDREVQVQWLDGIGDQLTPAERPGWAGLRQALLAEQDAAYAALRPTVRQRFPRVARKFRRDLARAPEPRDEDPPFRTVFAARLLAAEEALQAHLEAAQPNGDPEPAHRARIAGKQLRYFIEPVKSASPALAEAVRRLKGIQDVLGDLHDAHVLDEVMGPHAESLVVEDIRRRLRTAEPDIPEADTPPTHGLVAVARHNAARRHAGLAELEEARHAEAIQAGLHGLRSEAARLLANPAPPHEPVQATAERESSHLA